MRKIIIYVYLLILFIGYYSTMKGETLKNKQIVTQTFLSYEKESGEIFLAVSNYVKINVNEIVEFEVKNYFPELDIQVGEELNLLYSVMNNGNFDESYLLLIENPEIFLEYEVYIDSNKNGFLDKDEEIPLDKVAKNIIEIPVIRAGDFKNIIIKSKLEDTLDINRVKFQFNLQSVSESKVQKKVTNIFNIYSKRKVDVVKGIYFDSEKKQYYFTFRFLNESLLNLEKLVLEDEIIDDFKINSYLGLWQNFGETEKRDVTFFLDGYEKNAPNIKVSLINKKLEVEIEELPSKNKIDIGGILFVPFYLEDGIAENKKLTNIGKYYYILNGKKSDSFQTNEIIFFKKYKPLLKQEGKESYRIEKTKTGYKFEIKNKVVNIGNVADTFNVFIKNSNFPKNFGITNLTDTDGDGILDTGELQIGESREVIVTGTLSEEEISNNYSLNLLFNSIKQKEYVFSTGVYAELNLVKLLTEIKSDKKRLKKGEIFKLKIEVNNFYNIDIENMQVHLILPQGFSYIDNSGWIENNEITKIDKNGRELIFHLKKPLLKDEKLNLEISIKTDIAAKNGKNIFKTFSQGKYLQQQILSSNEDSCKIEIEEDNVIEKGTIIGVVYVDSNKNGKYDFGEATIPNVKIFLENGHFSISDKNGRYSIFGERPITHIAKLDKATIPEGGKLLQLDSRYGSKGDFAVVELKRNELYKLNFAFYDVNEKFLEELEKRKKISESITTEIEEVIEKEELLFTSINSNNGAVEVSGFFDDRITSLSSALEEFEKEKERRILEKRLEENSEKHNEESGNNLREEFGKNLEKKLKNLDDELDIINLEDNQVVSEVISLEIKNNFNNNTEVFLNKEKISDKFIGITGRSSGNQVVYYRYDGIKLKPEENIISVVSTSPMGEKKEKSIKVNYPVKIEDAELLYDVEKLKDITAQPIELKLLLKGQNGSIIREPYFATLESSSGIWILPEDLSKDNNLQFIIENGEQNLKLLPTVFNGEINFKLKIKDFEKDFKIDLKTSKKSNILMGIIEGKINFGDKKSDIFQEELNYLKDDNDKDFSYRTAILGKGNILDKYEYFFTYDNTKRNEDVFYQNSKRDDYYLVLGDNSIKGYEGQTSSKLFLSITGKYVKHLYGDYDVSWESKDFDIGNYTRTLSGYKLNYDMKNFNFESFISKTNNIQKIDEIPAKNISGPYFVGSTSIVENSEKIEIVVYDPKNLDIPIAVVQAPTYSFDHNTGTLYFDTIIPEKDKSGNLLFIRISYEVEKSVGKKYYLYGGNFTYRVTDKFKVGGSYFKDENPEVLYQSESINIVYEDKGKGKLIIEQGKTKNETVTGEAILVKYINEDSDKLKTKITYYDSDKGFENPASFVKNNARLFLLENSYRISTTDEVAIEGFKYKDKTILKVTQELILEFKKAISKSTKVIIGAKHSETKSEIKSGEAQKKYNTLGIKYEWKPVSMKGFSSSLEYEQDIDNSKNKRIAITSEYDAWENFKIYGKYDFVNKIESTNIIGRYKSSYSKLIGMEYKKLKNIKPYIEFREVSSEEKEKEIALGFKSEYNYEDKLFLSTIFERVEEIRKQGNSHSTNFILNYNYRWNEKKISINSLDVTDNNKIIAILLKNSYGIKLNEDLTFAIKNRYFVDDINKNVVRDRLLLGIAYRDKNDIYNSLFKYEITYDDKLENKEYIHLSHILNSVHNYQLGKNDIVSFGVGAKYTRDKNQFGYNEYLRGVVDINWKHYYENKVELGINTAFMFDTDANKFYALGLEGGYRFTDHLWLGIGYNFIGFQDRDFYEDDKYAKGIYLRFRLLLEESIFDRF